MTASEERDMINLKKNMWKPLFAILRPCCETSTNHGKLHFTDEMLSPKVY